MYVYFILEYFVFTYQFIPFSNNVNFEIYQDIWKTEGIIRVLTYSASYQ